MSKATEAGEELTDLEEAVCAASLMAGILDEAMVHAEEQCNRPPAPDTYQLDGEQFERLMFAISHLRTMVTDVKTKFYALYNRLRLCPPDKKWERLNTAPCPKCGKRRTRKSHDPCIANLPGVESACCGHGVELGFIVFENGTRVVMDVIEVGRRHRKHKMIEVSPGHWDSDGPEFERTDEPALIAQRSR